MQKVASQQHRRHCICTSEQMPPRPADAAGAAPVVCALHAAVDDAAQRQRAGAVGALVAHTGGGTGLVAEQHPRLAEQLDRHHRVLHQPLRHRNNGELVVEALQPLWLLQPLRSNLHFAAILEASLTHADVTKE